MQQPVRNRPPESRATRHVATPEFAITLRRGVGDVGNDAPQQNLPATLWAGDLYRLVAFIHRGAPFVQRTDKARFGLPLL